MSEELKTAELEAENLEQKDTENQDTQTDENTSTEEAEKDVDKQEESPFKAELDKVKADLAKKDDIISKKNRAIEALKKKKEEEVEVKEDEQVDEKAKLKDEIIAEYRRERELEKFTDLLTNFSEDATERELIQTIYDNRIVKTGNVLEDFQASVAIAHKNTVLRQREAEYAEQEEEENQSFSMRAGMRSNNKTKSVSPVNREAAKLLRAIGQPDAIKKLK